MSDESFRQLQEILIANIHYLSGKPLKSTSRNVNLLDPDWFHSLLNWLTKKSNVPPGSINNDPLKTRISQKEKLILDTDYFIVENNVYDLLVQYFLGGPRLQRPLVSSPFTNEPFVILNPIKFTINYNSFQHQKTVDPSWTMNTVKEVFCHKFNLDPSRFLFQTLDNQTIDLTLPAEQVYSQFGASINLHTTVSEDQSHLLDQFPDDSSNPEVHPTSPTQPSNPFSHAPSSSFFKIFLHCFCRLPPLYEFVAPKTTTVVSPSSSQSDHLPMRIHKSHHKHHKKDKSSSKEEHSSKDNFSELSDYSISFTISEKSKNCLTSSEISEFSDFFGNNVYQHLNSTSKAAHLFTQMTEPVPILESLFDLTTAIYRHPKKFYDPRQLDQVILSLLPQIKVMSPHQIITHYISALDEAAKPLGYSLFSDEFCGEYTKIITCTEKVCGFIQRISSRFFLP